MPRGEPPACRGVRQEGAALTVRADLFLPLSENPLSRRASHQRSLAGMLCHAGGPAGRIWRQTAESQLQLEARE